MLDVLGREAWKRGHVILEVMRTYLYRGHSRYKIMCHGYKCVMVKKKAWGPYIQSSDF